MADGIGDDLDADLIKLLEGPPIGVVDVEDERERKRRIFAQIAQYLARKSAEQPAPATTVKSPRAKKVVRRG